MMASPDEFCPATAPKDHVHLQGEEWLEHRHHGVRDLDSVVKPRMSESDLPAAAFPLESSLHQQRRTTWGFTKC